MTESTHKKELSQLTYNTLMLSIFILMGIVCFMGIKLKAIDEELAKAQSTIDIYDELWKSEHRPAKVPPLIQYDFSDWPNYIEPAEWANGRQEAEEEQEDKFVQYPYVAEHILITHYCACEICCGVFANGVTAIGILPEPGVTVAADPNVFPIGSTIDISGHIYTVQDTGVIGEHIDIFCASHEEALAKGKYYTDVLVYLKGA